MPRPRTDRIPTLTRRTLLAAASALALRTSPATARQEATPDTGGWSFTDDRGVTVSLPAPPQRVVAQVTAAAARWDYGVRPIAVFGPQRMPNGSPDAQAGAIDLDAVASIGEVWGEFDLEGLIELKPDVLVVPIFIDESLWYVPEEAQTALADRVPSVGIVAQRRSIMEPIGRFAELATALGADLAAPENLAAKSAFDDAEADPRAAIAERPGLTIMFVSGTPELFYVAYPTYLSDLIYFRELGMEIVSHDVDGFWEELSWEQAGKHAADLILVDARTGNLTPADLAAIETWSALPAVQADQIGPWYPEPIRSYHGYAPVLRELAATVRHSRTDIV